jgi:peptide deformylase
MECEGFLAVAWQHEMDHLDGHLFIEKLSILKRKKFEKDYKRDLKEQKAKNK